MKWLCSRCGGQHGDLPLALAAGIPDPCLGVSEVDRERRVILGDEVCTLDEARYFVRGNLELPIRGVAESFVWTLWVELERSHFKRAKALWMRARREREPPYPARLATRLPGHADTLGLPAELCPAPVGLRFPVRLVDGPHPLVADQREGIDLAAVIALAEGLVHG